LKSSPAPGKSISTVYYPQFDGLRAIAVLLVMLYHLRLPWFLSGFSGVQMFFVLSGFLITGILLDTVGSPGYLRTFYIRRALRIFPIYYLVLFVVSGIWILQGKPLSPGQFLANLFYGQNITLGLSNFQVEFPEILGHTWSLATEEQFYLLWPLLILALKTPGRVFAASALLVAAGTAFRYQMAQAFGGGFICWTSLPPNLDGLCFGGMIAAYCRSDTAVIPRWKTAAGIGALCLAAYIAGGQVFGLDFPWTRELCLSEPAGRLFVLWVTVTFGALLYACLDEGFPLIRNLSWPPLAWVGRISYGLYLFHIPIYRLVDAHFEIFFLWSSHTSIRFFKLLLSFGIAALSYRTIERYFLACKDRFVYRHASSEKA